MTRIYLKSKGLIFYSRLLGLGVLSLWLVVSLAQGANNLQVTEQKSQEGSPTLLIHALDVPISEVLREISAKSNIQFKIPEWLMNETVNLNIAGHTWASVVHQVLRDYSSIYIWNGSTRLKHVFLLDTSKGPELPPSQQLATKRNYRPNPQGRQKGKIPRSANKNFFQPSAPGARKGNLTKALSIDLSEAQLNNLASGELSSPLPEKLFENSKIKKFLELNGVKTIDDGKNPSLAVKVRKQSRKLLKEIRRAAVRNYR